MSPQTSELFFTRNIDNPRDCDIIGEHVGKPFFCRFETTSNTHPVSPYPRTYIYRNDDGVVAAFDWEAGNRLGVLTIAGQQVPMGYLVTRGSKQNSRAFLYTGDNLVYEWRRQTDNCSYDLYNDRDGRIASFTRFTQAQFSAVGPTFGLLQTTAIEEPFLLQSILALSLNRWIDLYGC